MLTIAHIHITSVIYELMIVDIYFTLGGRYVFWGINYVFNKVKLDA
jgi:hypothetical protein